MAFVKHVFGGLVWIIGVVIVGVGIVAFWLTLPDGGASGTRSEVATMKAVDDAFANQLDATWESDYEQRATGEAQDRKMATFEASMWATQESFIDRDRRGEYDRDPMNRGG